MKIVVISDTHGLHRRVSLPKGDVLVHCGDFCNSGTLREVVAFDNWLGEQDFQHKIVVAGNHDRVFEIDNKQAKEALTNCTYLQDSSVVIDGVKFYGSPWQPAFFNWAFNLPRGEKLKEKWDVIEQDTDVLITHGPAHGHLDYVPRDASVGCEELSKAIKRIKPKLHLCGHIHCGYGVHKEEDTVYVNASVCTERYLPDQKPVVVELIDGRVKL